MESDHPGYAFPDGWCKGCRTDQTTAVASVGYPYTTTGEKTVGKDKLSSGRGRGRINAGAGNDVIFARDGRRDRINCGAGRKDRIKADRKDRVRHCEIVKRPKR